jgi:cellulose synthase/poly-beta-1,6-N-acetylglucosamine synthase-like glycosyltransferase
MSGTGELLFIIFIIIAWIMTAYTLNFHYLSFRSRRNSRHESIRIKNQEVKNGSHFPCVTVQLPIYNEKYVARRLIDAVCKIDYPKENMEIQVLDDSDDETSNVIDSLVDSYIKEGYDIKVIRRNSRIGFKAGALQNGLKFAKGEFIAIFDADFIPPVNFLVRLIPYFSNPKIGLVQCRWGHVNEGFSVLTGAQAVSLDLHFLVEQKAKSISHLFMNFNGTAGIWRLTCIVDSGGWHTRTLVEDLDLSYRAQLRGWKCIFVEDMIVDAELPVQMNAAKRQQFRWAKGSMQVASKLLIGILVHGGISMDTKVQAFIQLTKHVINPLFLIQFLIFPILLALNIKIQTTAWSAVVGIAIYVIMGPASYIFMIRKIWGKNWKSKALQYLYLIFFASGISINNSIAVIDGVVGKKNEFLRTPKFGVVQNKQQWKNKSYVLPFTKTTALEIFFALYGCIAIIISLMSWNPLFIPVIALQTLGFAYVAYLSITQSLTRNDTKRSLKTMSQSKPFHPPKSMNKVDDVYSKKKEIINTRSYLRSLITTYVTRKDEVKIYRRQSKMLGIGLLVFVFVTGIFVFLGYQATVYPLDKAVAYLERAETAQTPEVLVDYVNLAKQNLPTEGNPVWPFATARTDFNSIQNELDALALRGRLVSYLEPNSDSYNTALIDMHNSVQKISTNLTEATPFLFASLTNIILVCVWIFVIAIIFKVVTRKKENIKDYEHQ